VDETDIAGVHVGSLVDMDVDALPGVPLPGQVGEVQGSAAGAFSLFP
jgi:multidrug resistance efflux pump